MRNDSLDLVINHLFETPTKRTALKPADQTLLERVEYCFTLQLSNPIYTDMQVRNALMNHFGVGRQQAYALMNMTKAALVNVATAGKAWVKTKIAYLLDKAAGLALAGDVRTAAMLTKIAEAWGRTYRTDLDEGDTLEARKWVQIEKVQIVTDPTVINVNVTERDREETRRLLKKYHIALDGDALPETENPEQDGTGLPA